MSSTHVVNLPTPRTMKVTETIDDGHSLEHVTKSVPYYTVADVKAIVEQCALTVEAAKDNWPVMGLYSHVAGVLQLRADDIRKVKALI